MRIVFPFQVKSAEGDFMNCWNGCFFALFSFYLPAKIVFFLKKTTEKNSGNKCYASPHSTDVFLQSEFIIKLKPICHER